MLTLYLHRAVQEQNGPLPPGLPHYHQLYQYPSMWSLQGLACSLMPPADTDLPGCPILTDQHQSPGPHNFGQAHQGHCHATGTRPIQVLWP